MRGGLGVVRVRAEPTYYKLYPSLILLLTSSNIGEESNAQMLKRLNFSIFFHLLACIFHAEASSREQIEIFYQHKKCEEENHDCDAKKEFIRLPYILNSPA